MKAKYYTYRNLNYGEHFSTKHRGIVLDYFHTAMIRDCTFHVSSAGRERCLRTKKRNVHAFVTSSKIPFRVERIDLPPTNRLAEVKYNPYKSDFFTVSATGNPITHADTVYLIDGRCFVGINRTLP